MPKSIKICNNHVGYRCHSGKSAVILFEREENTIRTFQIMNLTTWQIVYEGEAKITDKSAFGMAGIIHFDSITEPGLYQIQMASSKSVPFFIRQDVYTRTAYDVFFYSHIQRCGTAVMDWHDACHLDDGIRSDTGEQVDMTGGWHDAGDLRKWMICTMLPAVAMCWLKRHWNVQWSKFAEDDVLDELRWGNAYFLKMINPENGQIWLDTAGGVNGNNSDNRWTDNQAKSGDERTVNVGPADPNIQWLFAYLQALMAQTFESIDKSYAEKCLDQGLNAYNFASLMPDNQSDTLSLALSLLATAELFKAGTEMDVEQISAKAEQLLNRQVTTLVPWEGAFYAAGTGDADLFRHSWLSGIPAMALIEAFHVLRAKLDTQRLREGIQRYFDCYIATMVETNPFRIIPYSVWERPATPDFYRTLEGGGYYRMFMPIYREGDERIKVDWWVGTTSHLLSQGVALALAAKVLGQPRYSEWAYAQLHWVLGGNPFQASMTSGIGTNQPYPHSRALGIIPGGIMNGIGGDANDRPFLDTDNGCLWQTNEYWSPHNAFYLMTLALLENPSDISGSIGVLDMEYSVQVKAILSGGKPHQ